MNKKQIKQTILSFAGYSWFLSMGMVIIFMPKWNSLDSILRILLIVLALTSILEIPIWIYLISKTIKRWREAKVFCKSYADAICYTKKVHEQRYRCYLAGETKESRAYTETIKKIIPELIKCAQKMNELDIFNKKQKQQIKEGKKELQYLLTHFASQKRTLY